MKFLWIACLILTAGSLLADWESEADARIDFYRKANLNVTVLDESGDPVTNAEVTVEMQMHAFPFGTAVNADVLNGTNSATYRAKILENFNAATLENAHKWSNWESDPEPADLATQWCLDNGLEVRGHSCMWQVDGRVPTDVAAAKDRAQAAIDGGGSADPDDVALIRSRTIGHIQEICEAYQGEISDWDVINENHAYHDYTAVVNPDSYYTQAPLLIDWLNAADEALPGGDLFVNDFDILETNTAWQVYSYLQLIDYLQSSSAPLDGIGFQAHYRKPDSILTADALWDRLETFAGRGLKLRVTEFDMSMASEWTDAQEVEWLSTFYKTCFSHPDMQGITMWGFTDRYHWEDHAPLYDSDWNLKPSGQAYRHLIFEEWWTDNSAGPPASRSTDADGNFSLSAFKGDYKITVVSDTATNTFFQTLESDTFITVSGAGISVTAPLVVYDMQTTGLRTDASSVHPGVTAGVLTGNELNSLSGTLENPAEDFYTTWSPDTGGGTTAADALAVNSYVSLTVMPDEGQSISISNLSFNVFAATVGPSARQLYLFSDKTGFADGLELFSASTVSGDPLIPYNTSAGQNFFIDLSGHAALSGITDSVTFRFYIQTPNAAQSLAFDDIMIRGAVSSALSNFDEVFMTLDGASVILSWEARKGQLFGVQTNSDLVNGAWGPLYSGMAGINGTLSATNSVTGAPVLFYRVILENPVSPPAVD